MRQEMSPEQKYDYKRDIDICRQEIRLAEMALSARELLDLGYSGHGRNAYEWQASQLVAKLANALRIAEKLPLYSPPLGKTDFEASGFAPQRSEE